MELYAAFLVSRIHGRYSDRVVLKLIVFKPVMVARYFFTGFSGTLVTNLAECNFFINNDTNFEMVALNRK